MTDQNFATTLVNFHLLPDAKFNGHYLINHNISISRNVINLYISYTLDPWLRDLKAECTLNNYLYR